MRQCMLWYHTVESGTHSGNSEILQDQLPGHLQVPHEPHLIHGAILCLIAFNPAMRYSLVRTTITERTRQSQKDLVLKLRDFTWWEQHLPSPGKLSGANAWVDQEEGSQFDHSVWASRHQFYKESNTSVQEENNTSTSECTVTYRSSRSIILSTVTIIVGSLRTVIIVRCRISHSCFPRASDRRLTSAKYCSTVCDARWED